MAATLWVKETPDATMARNMGPVTQYGIVWGVPAFEHTQEQADAVSSADRWWIQDGTRILAMDEKTQRERTHGTK